MRSSFNKQSGFTLIEVLISVAIVGFIAYSIYLLSTRSYQLRDSLLEDSEFYGSVRLAMNILERDISLVYSPVLILPEKRAQQPKEGDPAEESAPIEAFWGALLAPNGIRASRFNGEADKLSFVTVSHRRIYKELAETEFAKVAYEIHADSSEDAIPGTSILVRKENPDVFGEEELGNGKEKKYTLLRGIKSFRLRYFDRERPTEGHNSWDSASSNFLNIYPDFVELTLELLGPGSLSFEGSFKMRLELPYRGTRQTL